MSFHSDCLTLCWSLWGEAQFISAVGATCRVTAPRLRDGLYFLRCSYKATSSASARYFGVAWGHARTSSPRATPTAVVPANKGRIYWTSAGQSWD
ncbi:hypothetical protein B0H19DRAFT_201099 [Mycena capillaripes]|nr:hypothetical protein B0H19DRAFT_201099 [Mycena capillaripes]